MIKSTPCVLHWSPGLANGTHFTNNTNIFDLKTLNENALVQSFAIEVLRKSKFKNSVDYIRFLGRDRPLFLYNPEFSLQALALLKTSLKTAYSGGSM